MQTSSNGVEIPFDRRHFAPMTDSSNLVGDPEALRQRYHADGYLYLRSVLDPERFRRLRIEYFSAFDPSYFDRRYPLEAGIFSGSRPAGLPPHGTKGHPAHAFVRSSSFADLAHDPDLAHLAGAVLEGPCEVLPRQIVRHFDRSSGQASRAHRDFQYLDQGSDRLLTVWIPLADAPLATGGLVYLEASNVLDESQLDPLRVNSDRPHDSRPISHDLAWVASQLDRRWLWTDFQAGDVTIHSPWTVHASLDNLSHAMRLSADIRFAVDGSPLDPRWQQAWSGDDRY